MVFILIIDMHRFSAYLREKLVIAVSAKGFFPDCAGKKSLWVAVGGVLW